MNQAYVRVLQHHYGANGEEPTVAVALLGDREARCAPSRLAIITGFFYSARYTLGSDRQWARMPHPVGSDPPERFRRSGMPWQLR